LPDAGVQRHRHRGVPADEILPRDLDALALALLRELEPQRFDGEHIRLLPHPQLPLQRFVEFRHGMLLNHSAHRSGHFATGPFFSRSANPCGASANTCSSALPPFLINAWCRRYAFSIGTTSSVAEYAMNAGGGCSTSCRSGCMTSYSACFSGGSSGFSSG